MSTQNKTSASEVHNEYMKRLHDWQKMCYFHYSMCWRWQIMQAHQQIPSQQTSVRQPQANTSIPTPAAIHSNRSPSQRTEYRTAPLTYRVTAEMIDFLILMAVKVCSLMFFMKLDGKSLGNASLQFFFTDDTSVDEMTAEDLQYMMTMGLFYRMMACAYEALFVAFGGATPGKMILGLEIVMCQACVSVQRGHRQYVSVYPGHAPTMGSSWTRSLIKNFSITFLVPAFFTVFFYQHRRASYDIVANTIVVKADSR